MFYRKIRQVISYHLAIETTKIFDGCIELDESYFGGIRKGKRGRGAAGKATAFGLLKRGGKVYTPVVNDTSSSTLMPTIARKIAPDSIVYPGSCGNYNALDVTESTFDRLCQG